MRMRLTFRQLLLPLLSSRWKAQGTQEGCHFDVDTQAAVIPLLRAALDARNLTATRVSASDENTYDEALSTWKGLGDAAQRAVGQINVHGYQQGGGRRDLLFAAAAAAKVVLRNSEYGEGDASGLSLATNLNLDLKWLHPTAWVYWQALDGGTWGLIEGDDSTGTIGAVNPKYYVLAQYSRHIRPGDAVISGGDDDETVAALSPRSGGTLIVVSTNTAKLARWLRFDLSALRGAGTAAGAEVSSWATEPRKTGGDRYAKHDGVVVVADAGGKTSFNVHFPPECIMTFELADVQAN